MHVLVAGRRQVDAGKTTFTRGAIAATGNPAFKPRAGNDRWYDYETYQRVIADGRLHGKDAQLLAAEQPRECTPEAINPIHRLWHPSTHPEGGIHDVPYREFLVDRVGDEFVVNETVELPAEIERHLPIADATGVTSLAEINRVVTDRYLPVMEAFERRIADCESAIVESYGDIAMPVQEPAFDVVATVEPGRVQFFDGDRYADAASVVPQTAREGSMEPIVDDVIGSIEPLAVAELVPLTADQRSAPVKIVRAYRDAYETLIRLGEETSG